MLKYLKYKGTLNLTKGEASIEIGKLKGEGTKVKEAPKPKVDFGLTDEITDVTEFHIGLLDHVKTTCKNYGVTEPIIIGMLYNNICAKLRTKQTYK